MHSYILVFAVICQQSFGLRKHADLDELSQADDIELEKRIALPHQFEEKAERLTLERSSTSWSTHAFATTGKPSYLMGLVGLKAEWQDLLSKINNGLGGPCANIPMCQPEMQNKRSKKFVAEFNQMLRETGKAPGWKLTFYSRYTATVGGSSIRQVGTHSVTDANIGQFTAMHYLTFHPETDEQFLERSENVCRTWDRACCCKPEPNPAKCEFAWSEGKCCKFKYGNINKSGCRQKKWRHFEKSREKVDVSKCTNGPEPEAPPLKFYEFVKDIGDEPAEDGVSKYHPTTASGEPLPCPIP